MAKQALMEGREVNPEILKAFPDLLEVQKKLNYNWKNQYLEILIQKEF
jgi:hypothetical protein